MRVVLVGIRLVAQTFAGLFRRFHPLRVVFAACHVLLRRGQLFGTGLGGNDETRAGAVFQVALALVTGDRGRVAKIVDKLFSRRLARTVGRARAGAEQHAYRRDANNRAKHAQTLRITLHRLHRNPSSRPSHCARHRLSAGGSPHCRANPAIFRQVYRMKRQSAIHPAIFIMPGLQARAARPHRGRKPPDSPDRNRHRW
ncbi:hypothetical protein D3C78_1220670 [compost metagenome]